MNAIRKIKRTIKKAKPNNYVPTIKIVGNKTDVSKFVNPLENIEEAIIG